MNFITSVYYLLSEEVREHFERYSSINFKRILTKTIKLLLEKQALPKIKTDILYLLKFFN